MQPIDPHTLFSIFEQGDEQIYREHGVKEALENPFVLMGMVLRGIENYHMMDTMYMKQYPREYQNVRKVTKFKYMVKLFGYLLRLDSKNFEDVYKIGESFDKGEVVNGLDYLRLYFEKIEHYEKCAVIKRYIDLIKEQPKLVAQKKSISYI